MVDDWQQPDDIPHHTPAPELYDAEEWEMLESLENGEWQPEPHREARLQYWRGVFRDAIRHGTIGPVDYDVPYPWAGKAGATDDGATPGSQSDINDNCGGGSGSVSF